MSNLDEQHERMKNGLAKELGSKGGKAKAGTKHLKTIIQEIGNNIDWSKTTLKDKDQMKAMYGNNAWNALVYVAFTKAMDWLAKNGYGTNIDITSGGDKIKGALVEFIGTDEQAEN